MSNPNRFREETGTEIFTGNELILKGALETEGGVHLLTGYPRLPVSGFFEAVYDAGPLLSEKGIVARVAGNEPLAAASVDGAQLAGCRAIAVFNSVGAQAAGPGSLDWLGARA